MTARYFWTTPEIAIVREHYPVGGVRACMAALPDRTCGSIFQQAAKLGLRSPVESKRGTPRKWYQADMFSDHAIRAVYENKPTNSAVKQLAARIGRPRWWVSKRALALGLQLPRFKEAAWSDDEIELLEANAHKSVTALARLFKASGYSRTQTSISVKRKRLALGITASRQMAGLYTANQIATLRKVDKLWFIEMMGRAAA